LIKKNKLLFIDGATRSGKSAICQTIIALTKTEHVDIDYNFEYIFAGVVKKKINLKFAKEYLDSYFSRYTYDKILGRNINFRKDDFSGIYNFYKPKIYLDRIKKDVKFKNYHYLKTTKQKKVKNDNILKELNSSIRYFPIQSHYLLENYNILNKLDLNFRLIKLIRHPVDNIYSYLMRGWGKIIKINKNNKYKNATYNILHKKIYIPWYLNIDERKYLNYNSTDRSVYSILQSFKKTKKIKKNNKILILNFDHLCLNPEKEISKICIFLDVKKRPSLNSYIRRANLPRAIDLFNRKKKYNYIVKKLKEKSLKKLLDKEIRFFETNSK